MHERNKLETCSAEMGEFQQIVIFANYSISRHFLYIFGKIRKTFLENQGKNVF